MSADFIQIVPYEITATGIVPFLCAKDTFSFARVSKAALAIIECAAGCKQYDLNLKGKQSFVVFSEEDQTITVLLLQKKKIELLTKVPAFFTSLGLAREAVEGGYMHSGGTVERLKAYYKYIQLSNVEIIPDIAPGNPNDIKALCKYANITQSGLVCLSLILFDVTGKKIKNPSYSDALQQTMEVPNCLGLIKIVFHHAHRSGNKLRGHALVKALTKAIRNDKPDVVQELLSHKNASEIKEDDFVDIMIATIKANNLPLFQQIYATKEPSCPMLEKLLMAAIEAKNQQLAECFLSHPNAKEIKLSNVLETAIRTNHPPIFDIIFSHPNAKEITRDALGLSLREAVQVKNPDFVKAILSHPNAHQIPAMGISQAIECAIQTDQWELGAQLLVHPIEEQLDSDMLTATLKGSIRKNNPEFVKTILSLPATKYLDTVQLCALINTSIEQDNPTILGMFLAHPNTVNITAEEFCYNLRVVFIPLLYPEANEEEKSSELKELILSHPNIEIILGQEIFKDIIQAIEENDGEALKAILFRLDPDLFFEPNDEIDPDQGIDHDLDFENDDLLG